MIYEHFSETGHEIEIDSFKIIYSGQQNSNIKVCESILINSESPSLNGSTYSTPLNII